MKGGLVVKDNALMNASYNLEVTEQKVNFIGNYQKEKQGKELLLTVS